MQTLFLAQGPYKTKDQTGLPTPPPPPLPRPVPTHSPPAHTCSIQGRNSARQHAGVRDSQNLPVCPWEAHSLDLVSDTWEQGWNGLEGLLETHGFLPLIPYCTCPVLYTSQVHTLDKQEKAELQPQESNLPIPDRQEAKIPAPPLPGCVTLSEIKHLSEPLLLPLETIYQLAAFSWNAQGG